MSKIIKIKNRDKNGKKIKKLKWWEKQAQECDALRASVGAKAGDGLKLLAEMQRGDEAQRALAYTYRHMSANMADAIISLYASNPTLRLLMQRARQNPRLIIDNTGTDQCPSSEPISAPNVSIASK